MRIRNHAVRELDKIDHKILAVLQTDARIAITELAERDRKSTRLNSSHRH